MLDMSQRTTVVFDQESLEAVKDLSATLRVSQSEAIRLAVVAYRDQLRGPSDAAKVALPRSWLPTRRTYFGRWAHPGGAPMTSPSESPRSCPGRDC